MIREEDDAISRQIISDYVGSHIQEINTGYGDLNKHTNEILRMIVDYIETMSPVNPQEPKTGHWVEENINGWSYRIFCSECGYPAPFEHISNGDSNGTGYGVNNKTKFCPNCGVKMIEPQEKRCMDCKHYSKFSLDCGECDDDYSMYEPREESEDK